MPLGWRCRATDYAILIGAMALLCLPNLGTPSLWDADEGLNAEATREMLEGRTWIIPTFNSELRTAKPVMLNWLQRLSYLSFGVDEWAARFPSVLAGLGSVLLNYELARKMFERSTAILSALVLASSAEFCALTHAATPDSTLLTLTLLSIYFFWRGHEGSGRRWWLPMAAACGLAVLTKGPVGVALPGLILLFYFGWNRELKRLLDRRFFWASIVFLGVAGPWYGMVTAETRGAWAKAFFLNENINRALNPMEHHSGPIFYHLIGIVLFFAPWSILLSASIWYAIKFAKSSTTDPTVANSNREFNRPYRFILCWIFSYLLVFSLVSTKLPNYVLPIYPALSILTARLLIMWRDGLLVLPQWALRSSAAGMLFVGVVTATGLAIAGLGKGIFPTNARIYPGLEKCAWIGLIPLAGAATMAWMLKRGDRARFVQCTTVSSVLFLAAITAFIPIAIDRFKAPRDLVAASSLNDPTRDIRVAGYDWFQPSLVFYCQREVEKLQSPEKAAEFLSIPRPAYLFIPESTWTKWVVDKVKVSHYVVARHYDLYRNCEIIVVANDSVRK